MFKYFIGSFICSILGLALAAYVGFYFGGTGNAALEALFVAVVLAVLEISLSFDNAILNAIVLKEMSLVWRRRFLTWGMFIAVFGMRLIFPLVIVSIIAKINPWSALILAVGRPDEYAKLMLSAHLAVSAFGGTFLLMVALKYFYDENKKIHWISWLEKPLIQMGRIEAIEMAMTLLILIVLMNFLPAPEQLTFLKSGMAGLITYVVIDGIGSILQMSGGQVRDIQKASAGMFLYLEVLDASFSFDGVVGAFAITHNLFIIMIGLSIGAFFVRSLTIMFVDKEALKEFLYLEHGAFYAIGVLAAVMLVDPFFHFPEWITGLVGAIVIGISFIWSVWISPHGSLGKTQVK